MEALDTDCSGETVQYRRLFDDDGDLNQVRWAHVKRGKPVRGARVKRDEATRGAHAQVAKPHSPGCIACLR